MEYKSFKDIKIGDYLYGCNMYTNKIYHYKVTEIIKDETATRFYFIQLEWDYIRIPLEGLEWSKTSNNMFSDINSLFNYINENA